MTSPIDIACVEDLAVSSVYTWYVSNPFVVDRCPAQVGAHRVVRNASSRADGCAQVEEDAVGTGFCEGSTQDANCSSTHYCADCIVPIGTPFSDGFFDVFAILRVGVDVDGVVRVHISDGSEQRCSQCECASHFGRCGGTSEDTIGGRPRNACVRMAERSPEATASYGVGKPWTALPNCLRHDAVISAEADLK